MRFTVVVEKTVTLSDVDTVTEKVSFGSWRVSLSITREISADVFPGRKMTSSLVGTLTSKSAPSVAVPFFMEYLSKGKKNKVH